MKRIAVIVPMLIFALMILTSCGIQQNSNSIIENNATQKPNSSEVSSQISTVKSTETSIQELKQFLNSTRSNILKVVGNQTENGTVSIMESHMLFPFTFAKDLGLTFVFPNETDDFTPTYIIVNKETNLKDVNIKGAKPGMDFKEIMDEMGKSQAVKTWISNEDNVAYKLEYVDDGVVYSFVSYDEQGKESQLYIAVKEN